jgi:hypothetical protein
MIHEEQDTESDDGHASPDFGDRLVRQVFGDDAPRMGIGQCL